MKLKLRVNREKLISLVSLERPDLVEESVPRIEKLRIDIAKDVRSAKRAIDELTHTQLEQSESGNVVEYKRQYEWFKEKFGETSLVYNSICKMIVTYELPRRTIIERVRQEGVLPAAFNQSLIAHPGFYDEHIVRFADDAVDLFEQSSNHNNTDRLGRYLRRRLRRYMSRLKKKVYVLRNGSSTRMEDGPNLQDINGMIYVTQEEIDRINSVWKPLIEYLKIGNFDDDFTYILATNLPAGTYGSINYAPDDSGKERISYSIDPVVQVISKAFHKLMDYLVKDLACNGTYRQMSLIRNMIKKRYHQTALCISTDMSKYSDTLQFWSIREILTLIGLPDTVIDAVEDLYTLPMWDSVLHVVTPRTTASYQGQYGDFPIITMMNLWNQCVVYDYINFTYDTHYSVELRMMKNYNTGEYYSNNATNSAVGDDTIMIFPHPPREVTGQVVFEAIRAVFNRCGVNINFTKTHILDRGVGSCDFIKRLITSEGLIPYFRIEGICGTFDDCCAELLRFYRDNIIETDQFQRYCIHFLGLECGMRLFNLHPINGGVIDRAITEDDLKRFVRRHESLNVRYTNRRDDELRQWFRNVEAKGVDLSETALVGFVEDEPFVEEIEYTSPIFQSDDIDLFSETVNEVIIAQEEEYEVTHEDVKKAILQQGVCGFKHYHLQHLKLLLGYTMAELRVQRPDLGLFLDDYQRSEAYRYMVSKVDHLALTTYSDMFSDNYLPLELSDSVLRMALQEGIEDIEYCKVSYLNTLISKRNPDRVVSVFSYGQYYDYFLYNNQRYRLYPVSYHSDYPILTYSLFKLALGIYVAEEDNQLQEQYAVYVTHMG